MTFSGFARRLTVVLSVAGVLLATAEAAAQAAPGTRPAQAPAAAAPAGTRTAPAGTPAVRINPDGTVTVSVSRAAPAGTTAAVEPRATWTHTFSKATTQTIYDTATRLGRAALHTLCTALVPFPFNAACSVVVEGIFLVINRFGAPRGRCLRVSITLALPPRASVSYVSGSACPGSAVADRRLPVAA